MDRDAGARWRGAQFDFGAYAVKQIRVLALEHLRDQVDDSEAYLFCVRIEFDAERMPAEAEPTRTVVLLARREAEAWRLARAPKELRRWILSRAGVSQEDSDPAESPTEAPPAAGPCRRRLRVFEIVDCRLGIVDRCGCHCS